MRSAAARAIVVKIHYIIIGQLGVGKSSTGLYGWG